MPLLGVWRVVEAAKQRCVPRRVISMDLTTLTTLFLLLRIIDREPLVRARRRPHPLPVCTPSSLVPITLRWATICTPRQLQRTSLRAHQPRLEMLRRVPRSFNTVPGPRHVTNEPTVLLLLRLLGSRRGFTPVWEMLSQRMNTYRVRLGMRAILLVLMVLMVVVVLPILGQMEEEYEGHVGDTMEEEEEPEGMPVLH